MKAANTLGVDSDHAESSITRLEEGIAQAFQQARQALTLTGPEADYLDRLVDAVVGRARERGWDR